MRNRMYGYPMTKLSLLLVLGLAPMAEVSAKKKKSYASLEEAVTELANQGKQGEALKLLLARTGAQASAEERFTRADLLERAGLWQLAMAERIKGVLISKNNASQIARIGELALITDRLEPLTQVAVSLNKARVPTSQWPATFRAAIAGLYLRLGDLSRATTIAPDGSRLNGVNEAARTRGLQIVAAVSFANGRLDQAAAELVPVTQISAFNPGLGFLQRSRIYFEQRKYNQALEELVNVPRSNSAWYSGVMTSAWSAYHLKDYNLALGQLMSLTSPYLVAKFNPEAYVLQAATFYRLCHFQSAQNSLKILKDRYKDLPAAIGRFKRSMGARFQGLAAVLKYARGNTEALADFSPDAWMYIMDGILNQENVSDVDRSLIMADVAEKLIKSIDSSTSNAVIRNVTNNYLKELEAAKREALRKGTKVIERRLDQMARETSEALENALAIEVEINTRVRERLITGRVPRMQEIDFEAEVKKGFEFWPFQGEFWRDEAGSYVFATSEVCGGVQEGT